MTMMPGVFSPPTTNMQAVFSPYTQYPQMQQMPQMQAQQPMQMPQMSTSQQSPIMNPNNNFMMSALAGNNTPNTSVGTPTTNTPATNMQNAPFVSQLRAPATGMGTM